MVAAIIAIVSASLCHEVVSIDGPWEYVKSASVEGDPPTSGWKACQVPHRVGVAFDESVWYRKTFRLDGKSFSRAYLRLWGAKFTPRVLLGGREVGRGFDGFAPATFDVTDFLSGGQETLHVACGSFLAMTDGEVDVSGAAKISSAMSGHVLGPIGSQWETGGLWESVELVLCGDLYIRDAFVKTSFRRREIEVEVSVSNHSAESRKEEVRIAVEPVSDLPFLRGDANFDGRIDIADAVSCLQYLFLDGRSLCLDASDSNDDGSVDVSDAIRFLFSLFTSSAPLPEPTGSPGADPTPDGLRCAGPLPEFSPKEVSLEPGSAATATLRAPWSEPVLWSPERPFLYRLEARIGTEARSVRFGFREFWCEGPRFYLNGVPRRLLAAASHPRVFTSAEARREIEFYKEHGAIAFRYHAQPWSRYWYDLADELGLLVVHESALWCGYYRWEDDRFWARARDHVRANVLRDRNHPSLVIWSIENEALLCGADRYARSASLLAELGGEARALDPTRPIMFEGDEDPAGSADIINLHYPQEPPRARAWPDAAWWLERPTVVHNWPRRLWEWSRAKPLYIGEFLWLSPENPHAPSLFAGDRAYGDFSKAREETKAQTWEMAIRAYRGLDVSGMCPWNIVEDKDLCREANRRAYRKVAAFARERESRFFGGTELARTIYLHNDLPETFEGSFSWEVRCGASVKGDVVPVVLGPSDLRVETISVLLPEVSEETGATFSLRMSRGGEDLFADEEGWILSPLFPIEAPAGLGLFDPAGTTRAALEEEGIAFADLLEIPAAPGAVKAVVVGERALGAQGEIVFAPQGPGASLGSFVAQGGQALVLQQDSLGWIAPLELSGDSSHIGFVRSSGHRALLGLTDEDLRFWYPGHRISEREVLKAAGTSAVALIDGGSSTGLATAPLMELRLGRGRLLISQLDLLSKRRTAPPARKLLRNLLGALGEELPPRPALGVLSSAGPYESFLEGLSLEAGRVSLPEELSTYGAVAVDASAPPAPEMISSLDAFASSGGRVLLHGLRPETFPSFSALFPAGVSLSAQGGPVLLSGEGQVPGLSNWELQWFGPRKANQRPDVVADIAPYVLERPFSLSSYGVLQAEDMTFTSQNVSRRSDGLWFYSNASATGSIEIGEGGRHLFAVKGRGTPLGGVDPQGLLAIDGKTVGIASLGSQETVRVLAADVAPGPHSISVAFANDAYAAPEDRNLFVDSILYGPDPDPGSFRSLTFPPALVSLRRGVGEVLVDQVNVEGAPSGSAHLAAGHATLLLGSLGGVFDGDHYAACVGAADFSPRGLPSFSVSGGNAWLSYNGEIWARVRWASSGATEFVLHAGGTACQGVYPHVKIKIDGQSVLELDIERGSTSPYRLGPISVGAGLHEVAVAFVNDAWAPPEDRNLSVRKLVVRSP